MSDPVTNVEIEDVLESIRLLIAAEDPVAPVSARRAQHRQDRLVLTPALRVDSSHDPLDAGGTGHRDNEPREEEAARPEPEPEATTPDFEEPAKVAAGESARPEPEPEATTQNFEDIAEVADDAEARGPAPQDDAPQTGEEADVDRLLELAMATTLPLSAHDRAYSRPPGPPEDETADQALEWEDVEGEPADAAEWQPDSPEPEDPIAGGEDEPTADAVGDSRRNVPHAPEPDDIEEPVETEASAMWQSSRSAVEPTRPVTEAQDHGPPVPPHAPEPRDEAARRSSLEATIAELEAAVTFSGQDFEADDTDTGFASHGSGRLHLVVTGDLDPEETFRPLDRPPAAEPAAPAERDSSEPQTTDAPPQSNNMPRFRVYPGSAPPREPEPQPAPQDSHIAARPDLDDDADLAAYLEDESVIDEEALRDLVGQIVREELQGALGERITRNVRKLVRREIHRILSSQDFD